MSGQQNSLNNRQAQLDAIAKQNGFPDYATMVAWERHRTESLQKQSTVGRQGTPPQPAPARPAERQQGEGVFGYIMRKLSGG